MGGIQRTVDIFREPVVKEDDASVKRGFLATILYAVTLAVAFIVIAVFLFQQERTYQVKVSNPTLQEFLDVESLSPTCSCSKSLIQVKDVPSLANFLDHRSSDLCSPSGMGTCSLIADAFLNVNETALEAAMTSDTDAQELGVWVRDVLGSADGYCYTISNSVGRIRSSLEATGIGAGTLLARTEFTDAMVSSVRVAFIDLSNIFSSTDTVRGSASRRLWPLSAQRPLHWPASVNVLLRRLHATQTLRNAAAAGNVQQYASIRDFGALSGATNHRPANCTCSGSNAMPFRKFDLQIGGQSHDAGCSIPATVHGLMAHALDTTLYDADYGIFTSEVRCIPPFQRRTCSLTAVPLHRHPRQQGTALTSTTARCMDI